MKAITTWQPYAQLIATGEKRFETRAWPTRYRGPVAIHAAKRKPKPRTEEARFAERLMHRSTALSNMKLDELPYGMIVCTAVLTDCIEMDEAFIRSVENTREFEFGMFSPGWHAFVLENVHILDKPIPVNGQQGLWDWGK